MGEKIGLLSGNRFDEMKPIPGQSSERKIGAVARKRFWESPKAESISDHKGIDLVSLILTG